MYVHNRGTRREGGVGGEEERVVREIEKGGGRGDSSRVRRIAAGHISDCVISWRHVISFIFLIFYF